MVANRTVGNILRATVANSIMFARDENAVGPIFIAYGASNLMHFITFLLYFLTALHFTDVGRGGSYFEDASVVELEGL
jgi:hypothetical protein